MELPEIAQVDDALKMDIESTHLASGQIAFWWLGQNSFAFKCRTAIVYTDPYLADNPRRLIPPPLSPGQVTHADIVTCSHDHADHIDPQTIPTLARASPRAVFIAPRVVEERLLNLGVSPQQLRLVNDGDVVELKGICVHAIKARHERFDEDLIRGFPYLSYVIEMDGVRFYHAGDGIPYDGLVARLRELSPQLIFIPINGRDGPRYRRNCIGNFTFQEAGDIAADVGARCVIPMHWGMFADNNEDVDKFVDYVTARYPELTVKVLKVGERIIYDSKQASM